MMTSLARTDYIAKIAVQVSALFIASPLLISTGICQSSESESVRSGVANQSKSQERLQDKRFRGVWPTCGYNSLAERELSDWLDACKTCLIKDSTSQERDLGGKQLSCSLKFRDHSLIGDLKIVKSSGSEDIDGKAMALVRRANFKSLPKLPLLVDTYGIRINFSQDPYLSVSVMEAPPEIRRLWEPNYDADKSDQKEEKTGAMNRK